MMLSEILAFGLQLQLYHLVSRATSIQDLENKLTNTSKSQMYSQACQREWTNRQFPKNCIFLIEAAVPWQDRSPQTVRTFVSEYCKKNINWTSLDITDITSSQWQQNISHYPECQSRLKEYLLDRQYKMQKTDAFHGMTSYIIPIKQSGA